MPHFFKPKRLYDRKDKFVDMKNTKSHERWYFRTGNKYAKGHGRPKGGIRQLRDAMAGLIRIEDINVMLNGLLAKAMKGDRRAALTYMECVSKLLGYGRGQSRPWNTKAARAKRVRQSDDAVVK